MPVLGQFVELGANFAVLRSQLASRFLILLHESGTAGVSLVCDSLPAPVAIVVISKSIKPYLKNC